MIKNKHKEESIKRIERLQNHFDWRNRLREVWFKKWFVRAYFKLVKGGYRKKMTENTKSYMGYCMKCKAKQPIAEPKLIQIKGKSGSFMRRAVKGPCSVCKTQIFKILSKTE